MFFNQAFQAPIVIEVENERISIPKFTIDDFSAWGAELDVAREKKLTAGMDPDKRFHFLAFYNILPMELGDLRRLARSPQGIKRITATCLSRARIIARQSPDHPGMDVLSPAEPLPADKQKRLLSAARHQDLARLAELLADVDDQAEAIQHKGDDQTGDADNFAGEGKAEGESENPLTPAATAESSV